MSALDPSENLDYLQRRMDRYHAGYRSRMPKTSKNIMAALLVKKGYGKFQSSSQLEDAWIEVAGELLAVNSKPGKIRRGVLEVHVSNSVLVQEMTFIKEELISNLAKKLPNLKINDIRCKVGRINSD